MLFKQCRYLYIGIWEVNKVRFAQEILMFPFGRVPAKSRIIIYGAGKVGQYYLHELNSTKYCDVVAMADAQWNNYDLLALKVKLIPPEDICHYNYDYIVIAIKEKIIRNKIEYMLANSMMVPIRKIISHSPIITVSTVTKLKTDASEINKLAYNREPQNGISMAFFVGNGLGDIIISKKIVCNIMRSLKGVCKVDFFGKAEFIRTVYGEWNWPYETFSPELYSSLYFKYDFSLYAMYVMSIDMLAIEKFKHNNIIFLNKVSSLAKEIDEYMLSDINSNIVNGIHFLRCKFCKKNAYTAYNYSDGNDVIDSHVDIPVYQEVASKVKNLNLGRYLTVHRGWGILPNNNAQHVKAWPLDYWRKLINLLQKDLPEYNIVQIGSEKEPRLGEGDNYYALMGANLEIVKHVLLGATLHVDNEGSIVHLATQLGTRCVVLFGPTPSWYFGYKENINLMAGSCHACEFLGTDFSKCLRGLDKPECMWSLTPEYVFQEIKKALQRNVNEKDG